MNIKKGFKKTTECIFKTLCRQTHFGVQLRCAVYSVMSPWTCDSCDPVDYSMPGFSVHGLFQARILEWVAISFSRGSFWHRD